MSTHQRDERGSATLELAILAPALLGLFAVVIAAGRIETAGAALDQAASAAARQASLARTAATANTMATRAAQASLRSQHLTCTALRITVDSSGFRSAHGQPAQVSVAITCTVPLSDLAIPGMPGRRTLRASMTSPLDRYRSR